MCVWHKKCRVGKVVGSTNAAGNNATAIKEISSCFSVDAKKKKTAEMTQQIRPVWPNVASLLYTLQISEYDICLLSFNLQD